MNNLDFVPGKDYTEYVFERLDIEIQEDPLYRKGETWYKPQSFQVDYETESENIGEAFVEFIRNNFSDDVRIVEARALEAVGNVQVVEPKPEFKASLEEIGSLSDLRETLISHSETFPDGEGVGYLNLDECLEDLSDQLSEDGSFTSFFLLEGRTEEDKEMINRLYSGEIDPMEEAIPKFDMELQSRTFVRHQDTVYEIHDE